MNRLTEWQNVDYQKRVWCAGVTIAIAIIMKETGVSPSHDHSTLPKMFPNLYLETLQRKHIVEMMDDSLKYVM